MHAQGTAHAHAHAHGHGANRFGLWYSNHGRQLSQIPTLMVDTELAATSTLTLRQLRPSQSSTHKMQRPPTEEELAALRQLSDDYRPSLEGPLLGKRQSTQAITDEYASADPVYVAKTEALPRSYAEYRTVQGDGNCGWRAIAFTYFETLQLCGDRDKILEEQARLKSLNNLLNRVGFPPHLYEDFVDETIELLGELATDFHSPAASTRLEDKFNNGTISSAIITHFRLLTSAWMKTSPDTYQPFIPDATVEQYCAAQIEPYQVEIDHIGMDALIDVLIKPAGFAVEVLYLDRSDGNEGNSHRFEATNSDGSPMYPAAPTIHLLYRPGHYDILYKGSDVQVNYALAMPTYAGLQATPMPVAQAGTDLSFLTEIPGMSFLPGAQPNYLGGVPVSVPLASAETQSVDYADPVIGSVPAAFPTPTAPTSPSASSVGGSSFRPSRYSCEYEAGLHRSSTQTQHYQTPSFKNSHYNPAHFLSAEFQPEIWSPESEHGKGFNDDPANRSR